MNLGELTVVNTIVDEDSQIFWEFFLDNLGRKVIGVELLILKEFLVFVDFRYI